MNVFIEFSENQRILFSNKVISCVLHMKIKDREAFLIVLCQMRVLPIVFLRFILLSGSNVV